MGDIIDSMLRGALGLRVWDNELPIVDFSDEVFRVLKSIEWDDISNSDFENAIKGFTNASTDLGIPLAQTKNIYGGINDI